MGVCTSVPYFPTVCIATSRKVCVFIVNPTIRLLKPIFTFCGFSSGIAHAWLVISSARVAICWRRLRCARLNLERNHSSFPSAPSAHDIFEKLSKLIEWHSGGHLSDSEFIASKRVLPFTFFPPRDFPTVILIIHVVSFTDEPTAKKQTNKLVL